MFPFFKTWHILSAANKSAVTSYFPSLDAIFKLDGKIISRSEQSEIFVQKIAGNTYFIKRYFCSKGLASWFGWSRFHLEVKNQQWFSQIGIPAAQIILYGEERLLLKTLRGVLITKGIVNCRELSAIAGNAPDNFRQTYWRNEILYQIADIVAALHRKRFCHNDLHWRNILVEQYVDGKPTVYLIDCPSGKKLIWPLLGYRKCKDLASLDKLAPSYLSRTQRLRFLLRYCGVKSLTQKEKHTIRTVLRHKENRIKRKMKEKSKWL